LDAKHERSYHIIYNLLKSDNTNSKHQHRVTEIDGHGSERALTAAYKDKIENKINPVNQLGRTCLTMQKIKNIW